MFALILLLVALAGVATQRGTTCAVSAAVELVEGKASRLIGFLYCAALALVMLAAGRAMGAPVLDRYVGHPIAGDAAAGGVIFGLGAWLNGRCAFGTIARLGSGEFARVGTIVGFVAGAWVMLRGEMAPVRPEIASPLAEISPAAHLAGALLIATGFALWLIRLAPPKGLAGEWTPLRAMTLIGLVNGALLLLTQRWPYTNLLLDIAGAGPKNLPRRTIMTLVFVGGAIGGALASGSFAFNPGRGWQWLRAGGGGALMGFGATLVPGGNDAMLLTGLPLLLPNLILAYLAMMITLILVVQLTRRFA